MLHRPVNQVAVSSWLVNIYRNTIYIYMSTSLACVAQVGLHQYICSVFYQLNLTYVYQFGVYVGNVCRCKQVYGAKNRIPYVFYLILSMGLHTLVGWAWIRFNLVWIKRTINSVSAGGLNSIGRGVSLLLTNI